MYDIIVIGAGPAGLTAALYALRNEKSVLILEKGTYGGQITYSPLIENYPGFPSMSGNEFADKLIDQVLSLGAETEMEEVTGIEDFCAFKRVTTTENTYEAKSVIIAVGVKHRQTGLANENNLVGNGISYCAVCDGAFFKGKHVAVLGGGNSALQEALLLANVCSKVTMIQNLSFLTGETKLINRVNDSSKIEVITDSVITSLNGVESLESLSVKNTVNGEETVIDADGLFVAIGLEPHNEIYSDVAELDDRGYFNADETLITKTKGVFVAGDCRNKKIRQISTATSDGAVAAMAACEYINNL